MQGHPRSGTPPTGFDVAVVGAGLAGLSAAAVAARAGCSVVVFETAGTCGGRARTRSAGQYRFNLGPHALYLAGHAMAVLRELGIDPRGNPAPTSGAYALRAGRLHALPIGFVSLLTTGLLPLPAKLEMARFLGGLGRLDAARWQGKTVTDWVDATVRHPASRALLHTLVRLSTYVNDPDLSSAAAAVRQVQIATAGGVRYLHDGWQTLVDALRATAARAGARIETGTRAVAVEHNDTVRGVRLADGRQFAARAVILTGAPQGVAALVAGDARVALAATAARAVPVRAACLDVAVNRLPRPQATFALGVDEPVYLSVHSASARLAPAGGATVNVAMYLPSAATSAPQANEARLEALLDRVQPGWRSAVVERTFLPHLTVAHDIVRASGTRQDVMVAGVRGLFVAGDWVGDEGWLADASLASGRRAGMLAGALARPAAVAA